MEKRLDIFDLSDELRAVAGECELTGKRTLFERSGRPVAILVSYDEYLALRETVSLAQDTEIRDRIAAADEQIRRGAMLLPEDLFVE